MAKIAAVVVSDSGWVGVFIIIRCCWSPPPPTAHFSSGRFWRLCVRVRAGWIIDFLIYY